MKRNAAHVHPVLREELSQHPAELVVVELQESVKAFLIQLQGVPLLPPQGLPSPKGRGERAATLMLCGGWEGSHEKSGISLEKT